MTDGDINSALMKAFPERENDYLERKRTLNDGEEVQPVFFLLCSLAPIRKIHLLRKNENLIAKDRDGLESLFKLNDKERKDTLSPLFGYLKQEDLLKEAEKHFRILTLKAEKESKGD